VLPLVEASATTFGSLVSLPGFSVIAVGQVPEQFASTRPGRRFCCIGPERVRELPFLVAAIVHAPTG